MMSIVVCLFELSNVKVQVEELVDNLPAFLERGQ
jgi:hypothetical protein